MYRAGNMTKMNVMNVKRFLEAAVADMRENNRKEIKCPCRKCKERVWMDPFMGGHLKAHLLMHGFMDGYTRWISEDDDEDVDGATNNDMGRDEEMTNVPEEETGHGEEDAGHGEDAVHEEEDVGHEEEDARHGEDAGTQQSDSSVLSSVM